MPGADRVWVAEVMTQLRLTLNGKRHCRLHLQNAPIKRGEEDNRPAGLPAASLEPLVVERIRAFLTEGPEKSASLRTLAPTWRSKAPVLHWSRAI